MGNQPLELVVHLFGLTRTCFGAEIHEKLAYGLLSHHDNVTCHASTCQLKEAHHEGPLRGGGKTSMSYFADVLVPFSGFGKHVSCCRQCPANRIIPSPRDLKARTPSAILRNTLVRLCQNAGGGGGGGKWGGMIGELFFRCSSKQTTNGALKKETHC